MTIPEAITTINTKAVTALRDVDLYTFCADELSGSSDATMLAFLAGKTAAAQRDVDGFTSVKAALEAL